MALTQATWDSVNVVFAATGPRRRTRQHRQDRLPDGHHLASGGQGFTRHPLQGRPSLLHPPGRRDRRPQRRRHPAGAGRCLRDPRQRRCASRCDRHRPRRLSQRKGRRAERDRGQARADRRRGLRGDEGPGRSDHQRHRCRLHLDRLPVGGGKTGTSEDLSDAWFVGYTPMYSTAVWTGHPLSRASTGFGGPTSGPIWRSYMEAAQGGECPDFEVPTSLPDLTSFHGKHTASGRRAPATARSTSTYPTTTYPTTSTGDSGSGASTP